MVSRKGFTLFEAVLTLVLLAVTATMGYMVLSTGMVSFVKSSETARNAADMTAAGMRVYIEIRDCLPPSGAPGIAVSGDELVFSGADGSDRAIGVSAGSLYLFVDGEAGKLAGDVAGVAMDVLYADMDGDGADDEVSMVEIVVTDGDGTDWRMAGRPRAAHGR